MIKAEELGRVHSPAIIFVTEGVFPRDNADDEANNLDLATSDWRRDIDGDPCAME